MFKKYFSLALVLFTIFITQNALAKIKVVTTLPNFAFLAREIGGEAVEVKAMLGTSFDPHFIDAKPSYITLLAGADLLISNGLELEVGYLPLLVDQSRNGKIRAGQPGSLILGQHVSVIDVPQSRVTRDMGDIHPYGNPHFYLSPAELSVMARAIAEQLSVVDENNKAIFEKNLQDFLSRWRQKSTGWKKSLSPLGKMRLITQHKSLNYLLNWLGWELADTIESKPGVPASSSRLTQLVEKSKSEKVHLILLESWYPDKDARFISEKTGVPLLIMEGLTDDYFAYFDKLFAALNNTVKP